MAAEATPQEPPASVTIDGKEYSSLADGEYDAIILGTGLQQVLLAGMLTLEQGKRVRNLHATRHTAERRSAGAAAPDAPLRHTSCAGVGCGPQWLLWWGSRLSEP